MAVLLAGLLMAARADACSCFVLAGTPAQQVGRALEESEDVFIARLKRSALRPDRGDRRQVVEDAIFEVVEVFKGELRPGQIIRVHQVLNAGTCGLSSTNDPPWMYAASKPGGAQKPRKFSKDWLVYSNGAAPYELNRCTRSSPLNVDGEEDVKILRGLRRHER